MMATLTRQLQQRNCVHHWDIDTPSGKPTVHGACKLCGEEKDFLAFDEGLPGPVPGDITEGKSYKPHQRIRLGPWAPNFRLAHPVRK
jgi:hypothetical protein